MKEIALHQHAQDELDDAHTMYEEARPGLGERFAEEVEAVFNLIARNPSAGRLFADGRYRRKSLRKFPYLVVYRALEDILWVVAAAHAKRDPFYWLDRDEES